ncbi:MAG TPA: PH domain-containing protein [Candidatus Binatia bacterium]|jgi:membrane protein YdbS with pleckstrin-like domain|nr:PH domain-containing protein [Candidatus Binatia bacterium]
MEEAQVAAPAAGPQSSAPEGTLYRARPHALALLPPGIAFAIALALAVAAGHYVPALIGMLGFRPETAAHFASACRWFLIIVPAIVGLNLAASFLELLTTTYAVTDSKATARSGLLRVTTSTVYLAKVESMVRDQGPLERLCDTGTVTLVGTGGGRDTLTHVRQLSRFVAALERSLPGGR